MRNFLSSHVLSEIQRNCTRAAIIREGKLIACDSVEALSRTSAKRVHVQGKVSLSELHDVRDIQRSDQLWYTERILCRRMWKYPGAGVWRSRDRGGLCEILRKGYCVKYWCMIWKNG